MSNTNNLLINLYMEGMDINKPNSVLKYFVAKIANIDEIDYNHIIENDYIQELVKYSNVNYRGFFPVNAFEYLIDWIYSPREINLVYSSPELEDLYYEIYEEKLTQLCENKYAIRIINMINLEKMLYTFGEEGIVCFLKHYERTVDFQINLNDYETLETFTEVILEDCKNMIKEYNLEIKDDKINLESINRDIKVKLMEYKLRTNK